MVVPAAPVHSKEKAANKTNLPIRMAKTSPRSTGLRPYEETLLYLQRTVGNEAVSRLIGELSVAQPEVAGHPVVARRFAGTAAGTSRTVAPVPEVLFLGVKEQAHERLNVATQAMVIGTKYFRNDAEKMVDEYIKEPPKRIEPLGALFEAVFAAADVLFPIETTAGALIYKTAKVVKETLKPGMEAIATAKEALEPRSVEEAKIHLKGVAIKLEEEEAIKAPKAMQEGLETVRESVEAYLGVYPQLPRKLQNNEELYKIICDAIGISKFDPEVAGLQVANKLMPPFRKELMRAAAGLHFFHELDNDVERLEFLIEQEEKGNDPDKLLDYIHGDRKYWDRFLKIYRTRGKEAAFNELMFHR